VLFLAWVFAAATALYVQDSAASLQSAPHQHIAANVTPAESSLVGTIDRFEEAARRLVLQTKDAKEVPFILAPDVVVRLGSHTLSATDLDTHRGRRAKIRYTQADGRRTAHWVVISSDPPRKTP
jgi:hypothetical protein